MMTWLAEVYRRSPVLAFTGWAHLALAAALAMAYPFDARTILGISPWIKPMKFSVSIAIFVWTLAWFLKYIAERRRAVTVIAWGVAICMFGEIALITMQSARGTASHFNNATPFDAIVFGVMGGTIGANTILIVATLVLFFKVPVRIPRAYLWGIRLGLIVFLLSSAEGVFMVIHGAHTVGAADGGPGLPFVNWSSKYGDLRVAHFAGMHALQILPLVGYWRSRSRAPESAQVSTTVGFSFVYLGIVAALFVVAMLAKPLVAL